MAVLSDAGIKGRMNSRMNDRRLEIDPFVGDAVSGPGVVSYGLSSGGYDFRLGRHVIRQNVVPYILDPNDPASIQAWRDNPENHETADSFVLAPEEFILGSTIEKFRIPEDVIATVMCKSTLARLGLHLTVTPLEPGWVGHVTLEIKNCGKRSVRIYANQGIGQVLFHELDRTAFIPYNRKKSALYQNQGEKPECAKVRS